MVLSNESLETLTSSLAHLVKELVKWHEEQTALHQSIGSESESESSELTASFKSERRRREGEVGRHLVEIHSRLKATDEEASSSNDTGPNHKCCPNDCSLPLPNEYDQLSRGCSALLRLPYNNALLHSGHSLHTLAAQMLAELARDAIGRKVCVDNHVAEAVAKGLQAQLESQQGGMEVVVELCRVLGNVCCENEGGRHQVLATECLKTLILIARDESRIKKDRSQRFPVVLAGLLLNFCNSFGPGVQHVGQLGFFGVVMNNVLTTKTNDAVFNATLNFLVVVAEEKEAHEYLKKTGQFFSNALVHVLDYTTGPEVTETALELLRLLVDDSELAVILAGSPLCSCMLKHVEGRWTSAEFEKIRMDACDSLVVLLSHDDAMRSLHAFDQGQVFNTFTNWLDHSEPRLQLMACQTIGNFACESDHRSRILREGTSLKLIALVQKDDITREKQFKVLTAALGGIHNLAVDRDSRLTLLKQQVLIPLVSLCERFAHVTTNPMETEATVFKLYSDIRLLVDEESSTSARSVSGSRAALSNIITWGQMGSQRVKAEASRLIAAVVKHAKSAETNELIVELGGMPLLTTLLTSTHTRMLNEALISLTLMAATLKASETKAQLHTDLVVNSVKKCLALESERPKEVLSNALALTNALLSADPSGFKAMLTEINFNDILSLLHVQDLPEAPGLQEALKKAESHN